MDPLNDRRQHTRFAMQPMYSRVVVQPLDAPQRLLEGHAYDISEGGVRFELDEALEAGTRIAIRIDVPQTWSERSTQRRTIFAFANLVWVEDPDAIGPASMAAVFTQFSRSDDEALLRRRLYSGRYAMAA
jgi:hypothetical protein